MINYADPHTLKAKSEGPVEIIKHAMFGYFSRKTGPLMIRLRAQNGRVTFLLPDSLHLIRRKRQLIEMNMEEDMLELSQNLLFVGSETTPNPLPTTATGFGQINARTRCGLGLPGLDCPTGGGMPDTSLLYPAISHIMQTLISNPQLLEQTQVKLVVAACALHNYIHDKKPDSILKLMSMKVVLHSWRNQRYNLNSFCFHLQLRQALNTRPYILPSLYPTKLAKLQAQT